MKSISSTLLSVLGAGLTAVLLSMPASASFVDNFDSYATGSNLHGQGGWKGWDNNPSAGALTTANQSRSAPNSVNIMGNSDLVHEFSGSTAGTWRVSAWQYIPSTFLGDSYFILLNTYADFGPNNWSTQVHFIGGASDLVIDDNTNSALPLIFDQWVELAVVIDLDLNTQTFYYGGQQLYASSWTEGISGGGALNIAAIDLFSNGASSVYYDDISMVQVPEPGTLALLGISLAGLAASRRRNH